MATSDAKDDGAVEQRLRRLWPRRDAGGGARDSQCQGEANTREKREKGRRNGLAIAEHGGVHA
jgi:hypothetical protein